MKIPNLFALGLTLAFLSIGCSKAPEVQPTQPQDNFEEQLVYLLPLLDQQHVLQVKYGLNPSTGGNTPIFYFLPQQPDQAGSREIVCTGTGVGFARCCKSWYDAHPGKCLTIWRDRKGTYSADDDCQQP